MPPSDTQAANGSDVAEAVPEHVTHSHPTGINADVVHKRHFDIPNPTAMMTPITFNFKKDKTTGTKRNAVTLDIPVPTLDGVVAALGDEKQLAYLMDVIKDQIVEAARWQVSGDKPVNTQDELDVSKLTLEYLANMQKAERRGSGISKETWEAFEKDFVDIMPALTNRSVDGTQNAAAIMVKRLQPAKTRKPVLAFLKEQLAVWFAHTQNAEEFQEVYEFLDKKADEFLAIEDIALLENLQ